MSESQKTAELDFSADLSAKAVDVARAVSLDEEARSVLDEETTAPQFVERLIERRQFDDAIRFSAHWLPTRASIWWGCLCAWQHHRGASAPAETDALHAALRWLREPTEEHRVAAGVAANEAGGAASPAGAIALAVSWSGGSLAPPGLPTVPPPPSLAQATVAGAVLLAAHLAPPDQIPRRGRDFAHVALDVARGATRWE